MNPRDWGGGDMRYVIRDHNDSSDWVDIVDTHTSKVVCPVNLRNGWPGCVWNHWKETLREWNANDERRRRKETCPDKE